MIYYENENASRLIYIIIMLSRFLRVLKNRTADKYRVRYYKTFYQNRCASCGALEQYNRSTFKTMKIITVYDCQTYTRRV